MNKREDLKSHKTLR